MSHQLDHALDEYLVSKEVVTMLSGVSHGRSGYVRDVVCRAFSAGWNSAVDAVAAAREDIFDGLSPQCGMSRHAQCSGTLLVVPDTRCLCECHGGRG